MQNKKNYNQYLMESLKLWITFIFILFAMDSQSQTSFLAQQSEYVRVQNALNKNLSSLQQEFKDKALSWPPTNVYIRSYKASAKLELWVLEDSEYQLFKEYNVCKKSGFLGPKVQEGDRQVPEGLYYIDRFNPVSSFHLSLGINYPNQVDIIRSGDLNPGGDIFIHGDCSTIGCLPMTDKIIEEIYLICVFAKNEGQQKIPVHIFPFYFNFINSNLYKDVKHATLWNELELIHNYFNEHRQIPNFSINSKGNYIIN